MRKGVKKIEYKYSFFFVVKYQIMLIPIKCFTCGNVLADKNRYYQEEVRKRKQEKSISLDKVVYLTPAFHEKTVEGEVMDELHLHKMCFRKNILTHVDIE